MVRVEINGRLNGMGPNESGKLSREASIRDGRRKGLRQHGPPLSHVDSQTSSVPTPSDSIGIWLTTNQLLLDRSVRFYLGIFILSP